MEIAKKIESGKKEILSVVLSCPMAVKEILNLGNAITAGKLEIREVTNELDEEESNLEEEQVQQKKILERIDRIRRMDEGIRKVLKNKNLSRSKIQEQVRKKQGEILDCFNQMNVRDSQVNKIVQKMKQMLVRVEKAENEIRKIEGKSRISVREARAFLKKVKARTLSEKTLIQNRKVSKTDLQEIDRSVKDAQRKINRVESECGLSADQLKTAVKAIVEGEAEGQGSQE